MIPTHILEMAKAVYTFTYFSDVPLERRVQWDDLSEEYQRRMINVAYQVSHARERALEGDE